MKISIAGDAYVVTSSLAADDIELLAKRNPDALKIKDEDGNEKFSISFVEGKSSLANFGITFGGKSRGEKAGLATYTGDIPSGTAGAKEFVAEKIGCVAANLKKLEESVPDAVKEVKAAKEELLKNITEA